MRGCGRANLFSVFLNRFDVTSFRKTNLSKCQSLVEVALLLTFIIFFTEAAGAESGSSGAEPTTAPPAGGAATPAPAGGPPPAGGAPAAPGGGAPGTSPIPIVAAVVSIFSNFYFTD